MGLVTVKDLAMVRGLVMVRDLAMAMVRDLAKGLKKQLDLVFVALKLVLLILLLLFVHNLN
jgi:hypothetical protein